MTADRMPDAVRRICEAMTTRYLALCDQRGVPREHAYAAICWARREHPGCGVVEMFRLAREKLGVDP